MILELQHIKKTFGEGTADAVELFRDFCFSMEKGEFASIIGSNGSGKTTLLNLICGAERPQEGRILFEGREITLLSEHKHAKRIGRVFQDPKVGTCAGLTILENLALADNKQKPFGLSPAINKKRLDLYRDLLEQCEMGLENRLQVKVGALSGGQRQALALVIATMTKIDLLVLDEHTAALDPKSSERMMRLTEKLVRKQGITTLMVTHNLRHAVQYGDRLIMMHEGRILKDIGGRQKKELQVQDLLDTFNKAGMEEDMN